ncbi:DUF523 domain-containing protein [Candidatus Clostridium stratigraminis]|uniref:DUF523 domain-containing protein n=1 Tax=Candidatus Clostridium stratigraminis TaxID=3381661 RepID=A0ABW8T7L4_9CLOT
MILVSACLCGMNTRYDGENNSNEKVKDLLKAGKAIAVCPEQLGGLGTPRPPHEISDGNGGTVLDGNAKVISKDGIDGTSYFIKGAEETLKVALEFGVTSAILKANSPSCGFRKIYGGTFSKKLIEGNGVTAELLKRNGIKIYTENDIDDDKLFEDLGL